MRPVEGHRLDLLGRSIVVGYPLGPARNIGEVTISSCTTRDAFATSAGHVKCGGNYISPVAGMGSVAARSLPSARFSI